MATGAVLRDALVAASTWLDVQAERVNALNVFPVPDGDTGTNMSLTLRAAADKLRGLSEETTAGDVAKAAYQAAMMGARGNSGVILSQLLRGFAHALEGKQEMSAGGLAMALTEASGMAYRGVSQPVEGTILTVARRAGEAAEVAAALGEDVSCVLEHALRAAADAVIDTPNHLDVLRKARVVDAGGEGYRVVLEGAWMWATGRPMDAPARLDQRGFTRADLVGLGVDEETPFGFCTEFLLQDCIRPPDEVKRAMEALGESVIAVGDGELLRVHVHTRRPGQALEFAVDHGTLTRVKVENMALQHEEFSRASAPLQRGVPLAREEAPLTTIGVIAVAVGAGFKDVFRSLGAEVVEGGQTMNPSVQDLVDAIERSGHQQAVILPNNSNVILTARQVKEIASGTVEVVPTLTPAQGIGALLAFNFQADLPTNVEAMASAAQAVHTVDVTRAVRDAEVDGVTVRVGEHLAMYDGRVVATASSAQAAALAAFRVAPVETLEIVTIYFGEGMSQEDARQLADAVRTAYSGLAVEVVAGGQPHYPFVLSLE